ncbi:hypothetical protein C4D60_Mb02t13800 [Musa balbisiana]|uniref:Uncharacterized protein n=1 Tax=Musa balbisiana TaxID=52838 RepID=A0A4S8IAN4_MUSBA|nr:hypothetical protein C4D60_Mb02t13800 [Musa balbisiana]
MSAQVLPEHICYVHCNFCNTVLAVSVPGNSLLNIVTVRCGHCSNLLSVNMGALLQALPFQSLQVWILAAYVLKEMEWNVDHLPSAKGLHCCAQCRRVKNKRYRCILQRRDNARLLHITGLSIFTLQVFNSMFREEIQRIKANNPDISHREAFSTAAKNWAHFPRIHFGLNIDGNKEAKLDEPVSAPANTPGGQKGHSFC